MHAFLFCPLILYMAGPSLSFWSHFRPSSLTTCSKSAPHRSFLFLHRFFLLVENYHVQLFVYLYVVCLLLLHTLECKVHEESRDFICLFTLIFPVLGPMVLKLECASESQMTVPQLQSFSFNRSGAGLGICMSNKFPGDTDAAGPRTRL